MIKIAGLWKRQGKAGDFLAGKLSDGVSIMVFPNKKKTAASQPDFELVIGEDKPRSQLDSPQGRPKIIPRDEPPQGGGDNWGGF
jgi:hypothetical protein